MRTCPRCHLEVPAGFVYCGFCGLDLGAATEGSQPLVTSEDADRSERRVVSVLFADLVGFTPLTEQLDAEEVRNFQGRYFATTKEVIERFGGTVEKFIGDAVMAVWGSPIAHEDDAERCVGSALDLVQSIAELGQQLGLTLSLRAGIMTGHAFVTLNSNGQGMVAGDLVNTASRLQVMAQPSEVLVGLGTYEAAHSRIEFKASGSHRLKGKAESVSVFRVISIKEAAEDGDRLQSPLVGRKEEFNALIAALDSSVEEQRLHVVSLVGIAGIGKSRLVWELSRYAADQHSSINWLQGRALAYGRDPKLRPLAELIRSSMNISATDEAESARSKLINALSFYVPMEEERRWIEGHLARVIGLETKPEGSEQYELFAAIRTFIDRVSQRRPTVIVLDQLQWADETLRDLVEHLIATLAERPLLILLLARPEVLDLGGGLMSGPSAPQTIVLSPLTDEAMDELLTAMLPGVPRESLSTITDRADGIPLYAVETVKMLLDEGRVVASQQGFHVTEPIEKLKAPKSLAGLVTARLDVLPVGDQALLKDASVLGPTFTLAGLAAVREETPEQTRTNLKSLLRRRVIALDSDDPRSPHLTVYAFVGGLIPEVSYQMLARKDRYERHLKAARFFERDTSRTDVAAAASHYREMLTDGTAEERAAIANQAKDSYVLAAQRLAEQGSVKSAIEFLDSAIELSDQDSERASLHELAADFHLTSADLVSAQEHLLEALSLYEKENEAASLARVSARLGGIQLSQGARVEGMQRLEAGLGTLVGMGVLASHPANPRLAANLSESLLSEGSLSQASNWADVAASAAEELDQVAGVATALLIKGRCALHMGKWRASLATLMGAKAMAEEFGFQKIQLRSLLSLVEGWLLVRPTTALANSAGAMRIAGRLGSRDAEERSLITTAWLAILTRGSETTVMPWDVEPSNQQSSATEAARMSLEQATLGFLAGELSNTLVALRELDTSTPGLLVSWISEVRLLKQALAGDARRGIEDALLSDPAISPVWRARILAQAGRASLWTGDRIGVQSALEAIESLGIAAPWVSLTKQSLHAGLDALTGEGSDPSSRVMHAIAAADKLDASLDAALLQVDLAILSNMNGLDSADNARKAEARLVALGARGLWKRIASAFQVKF